MRIVKVYQVGSLGFNTYEKASKYAIQVGKDVVEVINKYDDAYQGVGGYEGATKGRKHGKSGC